MSETDLLSRPSAKESRRARIIHEAHKMIGADGYDGLSLRKLAKAADVTVPTIYNLIGPKEQILIELFRGWIAQIEAALDQIEKDQPLDLAETIITEATDLIAQDEVFFRAAHIALNRLIEGDESQSSFNNFGQRASGMQTEAVRRAQLQGLLKGAIPAETLGRQIFFNYNEASRYWMTGRHSLAEFRNTALVGVYICFLADATDRFRPELLRRLSRMWIPKV
ncbi:MAG: TetR/AcrR family transcriptional regulator [Henriciella sp.]|nr:TetR/AcrR family transcriptional regulator [Henriciella sp.]